MNLNGKNVLVTGGSKGIGLEICNAFLGSGANVFSSSRSLGKTPEMVNFLECDFDDDNSFDRFLKVVTNLKIDILINNAGVNKIDFSRDIKLEDFSRIQKINVQRPFQLATCVLENMQERNWGRILNITSIFGNVTKEKRLSYSTSKFGLKGMTKTLALDNARYNILVNSVAPGFIDTELTRTVLTEKEIDHLTSQVPMKRLGKPEEIANLILFLSSELNSFVTGQDIIIDGGFTCV